MQRSRSRSLLHSLRCLTPAKVDSMEESGGISNKTFTLLIIATLLLSFGTSFYILQKSGVNTGKITGFALIPNGTATLVVQTTSSIRFTADTFNFGTGSINTEGGFRN